MTKEIVDAVLKAGYQKFDWPAKSITGELGKTCPDDGACHHECKVACFRVQTCGPLSDVYEDDEWPELIRNFHDVRTTTTAHMSIEYDDEKNTCTYLSVVETYRIVIPGKKFETIFYELEINSDNDDGASPTVKLPIPSLKELGEFGLQLVKLALDNG